MALVRRIIGDAQAKLRKMVDDNMAVSARAECDVSSADCEAADPLITPAVDSWASAAAGGQGAPKHSPGRHRNSKYYAPANFIDTDKKTALALDRKINFTNSTLANSVDKNDIQRGKNVERLSRNNSFDKSVNGSVDKTNTDADKDGRGPKLSLSAKMSNNGSVDKANNGDQASDKSRSDDGNQQNGKMETPYQDSPNGELDKPTEAVVIVSKYSERNILDADSSEDDEGACGESLTRQGSDRPLSSEVSSSQGGQSPRGGISIAQDGEQPSPRSGDSRHSDFAPASPALYSAAAMSRRLRADNERLQAELTRLRRIVVAAAERGTAAGLDRSGLTEGEGGTEEERIRLLENELLIAREAMNSLKADKKRLKAEKYDLLNQMKQLYATFEDKEKELRDFIRNYEQMRSGSGAGSAVERLAAERLERERERGALLRHARDEAERSLQLAAALAARDTQLRHAREQLREARRQLQAAGCLSDGESLCSLMLSGGGPVLMSGTVSGGLGPMPGDRGSCSADSGVRVTGSSDRESGGATSIGGNLSDCTTDGTPTITTLGGGGMGDGIDMDSVSIVSSQHQQHIYQMSTPRDCSPTLSSRGVPGGFSRSLDASSLSRSVEQLTSPCEDPSLSLMVGGGTGARPRSGKGGRGGAWGSISRVFARSRHRSKASSGHESEPVYSGGSSTRSWSPLWEIGNVTNVSNGEAARALREAGALPLSRWRAPAVLAWMELALGMPQYAAAVADNVKSGKVLLELSDADLEAGLGIVQPMHRKKLRLAIEERRRPEMVRYPQAAHLTHAWVAAEWLPDLGLAQYAETFMMNMVDARMLDNLSKKELEKYLGVTRKFHQASIVHGIHLLRLMKYDRQALAMRRHQCANVDADPLVWTNQRFIRWAHTIDLAEYADNLKESGVHGGLVVLEPSFTGDTMATALGIPPSKGIVRRHLAAELDALIMPARSTLCHQRRSFGHQFSRSLAAGLHGMGIDFSEAKRYNLRGSITKALGLKSKQDKISPSSSSENSSIVSLATFASHQYRSSYSPPHISHRTLSQLSMTYQPPPTLPEYEPIYTPLSLCSNRSLSNKDSLQRMDFRHNNVPHRTLLTKIDSSHRVSSPLPLKGNQEANAQKRHRRVKSIGDINASMLPT